MRPTLDSMVSRVFLTLATGVVASIALTFWLSDRDRQSTFQQMRSLHAAERVVQLVLTLDALPEEDRPHALAGAAIAGLVVEPGVIRPWEGSPEAEADATLTEALLQRLGERRQLAVWRWPCSQRESLIREEGRRFPGRSGLCRSVSLQLADGTSIQLRLRPTLGPPHLPHEASFLPWLAVFALCIGFLAYVVARMVTRPLRRLAAAAIELGQRMDRPPLPVDGPIEVREAATAFNAMQERIRRHVQERMRMLAAITHDLQTPMTRLRLRLEKVGELPLRERLVADLAAMQAMVKEGLDLVRALDAPLDMAPLDLQSLLDSVCLDAVDAGQDVALEGGSAIPVLVMGNAASLRRCLANLLDNAVKYGSRARAVLLVSGAWVRVSIRDQGPGIPQAQLEAVLEPFARLENSRSRDTGGTGLGLTIAREIAVRHGGTLSLTNVPQGGLEVCLTLPIKA